jgi:hypothetical protein
MKHNIRVRTDRENNAHRRGTNVWNYLWLLTFLSALQLIAVGCGGKDEKQAAESSTGTQSQAGKAVAGAGGSDTTSSAGGRSSSTGGSTANATGVTWGSDASGGEKGGAGGATSSSQGGASGRAGMGGGAGTAARKPACRTQSSQIVLIGDSYVNWITHTFPDDFNEVVGETVRNYAVGGYSMASGGIGLIPPELDQAITEDPDIIAVVMDGGGNDILIPDTLQFPQGGDCKNDPKSASTPDCQAIVKLAIDTAVECMDRLVEAGIPDVIYFFYPRVPSSWLAEDPNGILEYALPLAKEACDTAFTRTKGKLTCRFVDLIPVFEGHPEYFAEADLHENSEGSAAMAKAIWKVMVDNCIAQPESSGCCTP